MTVESCRRSFNNRRNTKRTHKNYDRLNTANRIHLLFMKQDNYGTSLSSLPAKRLNELPIILPQARACQKCHQSPVSTSALVFLCPFFPETTSLRTDLSKSPFDMASLSQLPGHNTVMSVQEPVFYNVQIRQYVSTFYLSGPRYFQNVSVIFEVTGHGFKFI